MIPTQIKIGHYRALRGVSVPLGDYTAMVGPNGVGKSTILDAVDFFLSPTRAVDEDDFQSGCADPVSVTLTLSQLNNEERAVYAESLDAAGNLVVSKVFRAGESPQYEVLGSRHRGFDELRKINRSGKKTDFTNAFKVLVVEGNYHDLNVQRSADDNLAELVRWEKAHPDRCEEGPVPIAFVGSTKDQLIPTTRFVYVPAVQEASDTLGGTKSPLQQMLGALVYPRFEADEEFIRLQNHVAEEYRRLFPPDGTPELVSLATRISGALETFCPGTSVTLGWDEFRASLKIPPVLSAVVEDGIPTEVDRKGHGLQRALIIAMLQAEDEHRRTTDGTGGDVHVILMIEEPELYQHPTQCRHFRKVLANLASSKGGSSIRVLVTTHSPDFISLDGIDAIRILRRETVKKGVPPRKISSVSLETIATRFAEVTQKPVDQQQLFRQLHVVDSIMREAFFASAAVLLEGVGDHGLLAAQCAVEGIDLEGKGIVLIPCGGKSNMPLSLSILRLLGIKHYAVFDSDRDPGQNGPVLRALGVAEKDIPKAGTPETAVNDTYAILKPNVERVVSDSVGKKVFEEVTAQVGDEYGRTPEQTLKNPATAERVLAILRDKGLACEPLRDIALKISAL
jgi:putative ATP-dependent endonuclease of the OLD family